MSYFYSNPKEANKKQVKYDYRSGRAYGHREETREWTVFSPNTSAAIVEYRYEDLDPDGVREATDTLCESEYSLILSMPDSEICAYAVNGVLPAERLHGGKIDISGRELIFITTAEIDLPADYITQALWMIYGIYHDVIRKKFRPVIANPMADIKTDECFKFLAENLLGIDTNTEAWLILFTNRCSYDSSFVSGELYDNIVFDMLSYVSGEHLTVPQGVELIEQSDVPKDVTGVTLPDTLIEIGPSTFEECRELKEVDIPDSVMEIGESAFKYCVSLGRVSLPCGLTEIKKSTFVCTAICEITLPDKLEKIGKSAFGYCRQLTGIVLPESLTYIGDFAFEHTAIENVELPLGIDSVGGYTFSGCAALKTVSIPAHVRKIGESAFNGCRSLAEIKLPEQLARIGADAFEGCSGLTSVIIPDSVSEVCRSAFMNCGELSRVVLSRGMSKVEAEVFAGCTIGELHIPVSVREIDYYAFKDSSIETIVYDGTVEEWKAARLIYGYSGCVVCTDGVIEG